MITINLLPPELRPVERTPLPRFLVIILGVALGAVGLVMLIFMHFIWIPGVHDKITNKEQVLLNLRLQAAEHQVLAAALQNITQRTSALEQIWRTRTLWWVKLDLLSDLTPSYVGLMSFSFREPPGARTGMLLEDAGTLKMECIAAKAEEKRVASFRRILKGELPPDWGAEPDKELGKEFIEDFVNGEILDYGWKVVELPDYPNQPAIRFTLEMKLKPKVVQQTTSTPAPGIPRPVGTTR